MYILGHAGLTAEAARRVDPKVDRRWAAALALGPDLLDKPLSVLAPSLAHGNTRGIGHTLVFSVFVFAALLAWKRKPRAALLLWACWAGHFVLDSMWLAPSPAILFWPALGGFPPPSRGPLLSPLTAYNFLGEAAGFWLIRRAYLSTPGRRASRA